MRRKDTFCPTENLNLSLKTKCFGKICKYHKRAGQEYEPNQIVKDFCYQAFYTAYPHCLALLYNSKKLHEASEAPKYNAKVDRPIKLSCGGKPGIVFEVCRRRAWFLPFFYFYRLLKWFSVKLAFPLDIEDWQIELKVLKNNGGCPKKYRPGKNYIFNIGRLDELCPASFHQLYPFLFSGKAVPEIHCPDHEGMSYQIFKRKS